MYNIRPMPSPLMGAPVRPGIATPYAPALQPASAPVMANPGSFGRALQPMGPTMGNHFVNQA